MVETRYSTTKEVYRSLTHPIDRFPTIPASLKLLSDYISKGYHPFILSASPHFYENAIRDWLHQRNIFTAGIFLKDYRQVFSLFDGELTLKDLKVQGLYKFSRLLDILLMTEVPQKIALIGDSVESDPLIYAAITTLLEDKIPAWSLWKSLRENEKFRLTRRQKIEILNKIYQIESSVEKFKAHNGMTPEMKIHIRREESGSNIDLPQNFRSAMRLMELYDKAEKTLTMT